MTAISELMATDPLNLTDQDITKLVNYMRQSRKNFLTKEMAPKKVPKPRRTSKKTPASSTVGEISLEGLE